MQKQVSLLVGHYGARENLLSNIQQLQTNTGRRIIQLLSESSCDNEECTLDTFFSAETLIWKGVPLEKGSEGELETESLYSTNSGTILFQPSFQNSQNISQLVNMATIKFWTQSIGQMTL